MFHTPNSENFWVRVATITPERLKLAVIGLLEKRAAVNVYPTLYRADTVGDITRLAVECGFRVTKLQLCDGPAVTAALGPLAALELVWQRLRSGKLGEQQRSNLVVILTKV